MKFQGSKPEIEAPDFEMKFQDSKPEIEAPEAKIYFLHCKMYVFGRSAVGRQDFDAFFCQFLAISGKIFKCVSRKVCCFGGVFGGCQKSV